MILLTLHFPPLQNLIARSQFAYFSAGLDVYGSAASGLGIGEGSDVDLSLSLPRARTAAASIEVMCPYLFARHIIRF